MINVKELKLLAVPLILGGRSTTGQDHFSTEPGKGLGWKSMSETHQLIQVEGRPPAEGRPPVNSRFPIEDRLPNDMTRESRAVAPVVAPPYIDLSESLEGIQRIPEEYLRIWIPPYQDDQGNLHEGSFIQTVVKSGQWKVPNPTIDERRKAS